MFKKGPLPEEKHSRMDIKEMEYSPNQQKKYNSIDLGKLVMAFAVVASHTEPLEKCSNDFILGIYELVVPMAVPFFFLASGYLLAAKMTYPYHSEKDALRIKRYLIKIMKMYLFWTIIYCPLAIYHFISSGTSLRNSILLYIRGGIFLGEQYNSWQLWYLLSTIYALIVVLLLLKMRFTPRRILGISFIVSIVSLGVDMLVAYTENLPSVLNILQLLLKYSIANGRILGGIIYIPIGMFLAYKKIPNVANWFLLCGGLILNYVVELPIVSNYLFIITVVGFFGVIENLQLKDNSIYPFFRSISTIIYFIHMYVWTFYYMLIYGEKTFGLDSFVITSLVSCLIAIGFTYLIKKKRA